MELAERRDTGRKFALKFPSPAAHQPGTVARDQLTIEVDIMMHRLDHPNVCKVLGVHWSVPYPVSGGGGATRDQIMVVLPLAERGMLFSYLQHSGRFPEVTISIPSKPFVYLYDFFM